MKYLVYEMSLKSPEPAEERLVWSILLFAKNPVIASPAGWGFVIITELPNLDWKGKFEIYTKYRKIIETQLNMPWDQYIKICELVASVRRKKQKNAEEMLVFKRGERMQRSLEQWFISHMTNFYSTFHYGQIIPLTAHQLPPDEEEVKIIVPLGQLDDAGKVTAGKYYVQILTDGLASSETMLVLDSRLDPFIEVKKLTEYKAPSWFRKEKKIKIYTEKFCTMPLCYSLRTSEISMARNEFKAGFCQFDEMIQSVASKLEQTGGESATAGMLKSTMEKVQSMRVELQKGIDNNLFIQKATNEMATIEKVTIHIAFATPRQLLKLLRKASMIDEGGFQHSDRAASQHQGYRRLKPFIYVTPA